MRRTQDQLSRKLGFRPWPSVVLSIYALLWTCVAVWVRVMLEVVKHCGGIAP